MRGYLHSRIYCAFSQMTDEGVRRVRVLGLWGPFLLCASYMRSREVRFLVNFKFTRMCWCVCVVYERGVRGSYFPYDPH